MKTTYKMKLTGAAGVFAVAALTFMSAPTLRAQTVIVQPPAPPPVVVPAPAPPGVSVSIGVPDDYVWDGQEYVGTIGGQYYYLGPGNVWMPLPQDRVVFFNDWERHHHDWRERAIINENYRIDSHGKIHPYKGDHHHHDHEYDRDHD